eukprot:XP_003727835.1 PREDICTED: putative cell agglutination protein 1742.01 [Strongylocentrotus purpuratus]
MELLFVILLAVCFFASDAQNCTFTDDYCGYTNGGGGQLQWLRVENLNDIVQNYLDVDLTATGRTQLATLTSPALTKQTGVSYRFSFDYRVTGDHTLHVRASGAGGGGWEHTGDTTDWENAMLVLAPPTDTFNILIFANIGSGAATSRVQISNLIVNSDANNNCDPSPCLNDGECFDIGSAVCTCINGYSGDTCEIAPIAPTTAPPPTTALVPTTPEATTATLTTEGPTTFDPITVDPTTGEVTTGEPTTEEPTTVDPTTDNPSTFNPDTVGATTSAATTGDPTTNDPTTEEMITTDDPTTVEASTQDATTAQLTTVNPATDEQSTEGATTVEAPTDTVTTVEVTSQITFTDSGITEEVSTVQITTASFETGPTTSDQETGPTTTGEMTSVAFQTTEDATEATATTDESTDTELPGTTGNAEPTELITTGVTTSTTDDLTEGPETTKPQGTDKSTQRTEGELATTGPSTTSSAEQGGGSGLTDATTGLIIGLSLTFALLLILLVFTLVYFCTHRDRYGVSDETMENGAPTPMATMRPGSSRNAEAYENPYVTAPTPSTERSTQTSLSAINV